jgi:hypothetical protein
MKVYMKPVMITGSEQYSKAKLKSNGDRASPCFRPFGIGNFSDVYLHGLCYRIKLNTY